MGQPLDKARIGRARAGFRRDPLPLPAEDVQGRRAAGGREHRGADVHLSIFDSRSGLPRLQPRFAGLCIAWGLVRWRFKEGIAFAAASACTQYFFFAVCRYFKMHLTRFDIAGYGASGTSSTMSLPLAPVL